MGTWESSWKLKTQMSNRNIRRYFFILMEVGKWNDLGEEVVEVGALHTSMSRYNKAHKVGGVNLASSKLRGRARSKTYTSSYM